MSEIAGLTYLVLGGIVAGHVLYSMNADGVFDEDKRKGELSFFALMLLAALIWLAWPVAAGALWARHRTGRAALRKDAGDE